MGFGMGSGRTQKAPEENPTFNSLLASPKISQVEHTLFYSHFGFASLGSACPAVAGREEEQIPALPSRGLGLQKGWSLFQPHLGWFQSCRERGRHSASKRSHSKGSIKAVGGQHNTHLSKGLG